MIGSDRKLFEEGSAVRERMRAYSRLLEEMHIIVFAGRELGLSVQKLEANITLHPTNSTSRWRYPFDAARIGAAVGGADIVTAQDPFEAGYAAWRVARAIGARLQLQIHTDFLSPYFVKSSVFNKIRVMLARFLLPRADCVRVVSERIARSLTEGGVALRQAPFVLPIYTDIRRIRNYMPLRDLHAAYPQFTEIILMLSRLTEEKDIPTALRAFASVRAGHPRAGLVIVGSGPERARLAVFAAQYGVADAVAFEPWADDPLSCFKTADIFLTSSLYEGYGLTLVEAAASDCPIVTTDVGIAREVFGSGRAALICPVGDEKCLAEQVVLLLQNSGLRRQTAFKAQSAVEHMVGAGGTDTYAKQQVERWEACVR